MWPYKTVTRRQLEEQKDLVERLLERLGAVPTDLGRSHPVSGYGAGMGETFLSHRTVYRCRGGFYRVDELLFREKPFLVMECADLEEDVKNGIMEDADPFPWDLGEEKLLEELQRLLGAEEKMEEIRLAEPTMEYEDQVMAYKAAFFQSGDSFAGCAGLETAQSYAHWLDFEGRLSKAYGEGYVPSTVRLGVRTADDRVVGIIDFRHRLNPFLLAFGGNIGYSVLPSERGKGYAREMLRQMLALCREEGLDRVLVTCDRENTASARIILANGGVLENEVADEAGLGKSGVIRRYWIDLRKEDTV